MRDMQTIQPHTLAEVVIKSIGHAGTAIVRSHPCDEDNTAVIPSSHGVAS